MNKSFGKDNNRSKSAIRNSSLSNKKTESSCNLTKDITKISSFLRAYGKVQMKKRFKSTRDLKFEEKPQISISTNKLKPNATTESTKALTKIEKYSKKNASSFLIENDILKAKSDLLDLKRDLATYEFELTQNIYQKNIVRNLQVFHSKIEKSFKSYLNLGTQELADKIKNSLSNPIKFIKNEELKVFSPLNEVHKTKDSDLQFQYKKIIKLSGTRCLISIRSLNDNHKIESLLPNGKELKLSIEKSLSNLGNFSKYCEEIENNVVKFLFIEAGPDDIQLGFDEKLMKTFVTFYTFIKGFKFDLVRVTDAGDNFLIEAKSSLFVSKSSIQVHNFQGPNYHTLETLIKTQLFYSKKSLFWGENAFALRDSTSKYLSDKYIDNLFDENLKKHCSFKYQHNRKLFKFDFYETSTGKHMRITSNRQNFLFPEHSYEYHLSSKLQSFDLSNSQLTLSCSLELRLVIESLYFPSSP